MLNVYICEDNEKQKEYLEKIIEDIILIEDYDMHLSKSTAKPNELLEYVKKQNNTGLYFLDIDLRDNMNGIQLASNIREYDPRGFIVFVTTHAEMTYLTFDYKVEAMDYIIKDKFNKVRERIHECIQNAYKKYSSKSSDVHKVLNIKVNDRIINIEFNKILYIETSSVVHKLIIHTMERRVEFYSKMKDIMSELDKRFYRCHNSYIINREYIKEIDINKRCIYMINDDKCLISVRMLKGLINK